MAADRPGRPPVLGRRRRVDDRAPKLDGSGVQAALVSLPPGRSAYGVAADEQYVYWAAHWIGGGAVGRARLDGTAVQQGSIPLTGSPSALAVDATHVYWTQGSDLGRAAIDGSGANPAFKTASFNTASMTIAGGRLYWGVPALSRMKVDGSAVESNFATGFLSFGLVVVERPAAAPIAETVSAASGTMTPVTLRNTGGADLRVSSATVAGADAGDFTVALGTCAAPVSGGGSCALEVTFAPQTKTAGTRSARVEVAFLDGVAPLSINVSGEVKPDAVPQDPPAPPAEPAPPSAPVATTCRSARKIAFHLPKLRRGQRYARVDVLLGGKRVQRIKRPKRTFTVSLAGHPKGAARVRISVTDARGRTKTRTRTFKTCTPGR